jgi:hypothetical protein
VIPEVYRSGVYVKAKPHVVNGQPLKHYIADQKFMGNVEELNLTSPYKEREVKKIQPRISKSIKRRF